MKSLVIPMKTVYNISDRIFSSEPYPRVNFVKYAKRPLIKSGVTHICGRTQSHSFWRNLSCSSVLQETQTQMAFAEKGSFPSTFQPLSSGRINPGYDLCLDCWYSLNYVIASVSEAISRLPRDGVYTERSECVPRNDMRFTKHLRKLKR